MALPAPDARAAPDRSHLWVAFARGDRVVGRVARADGRIRWGPSLGIEFAYPVPGVDEREELFRPVQGGVALWLRDGLTGALRAGSTWLPVEELAAWGLVRGRGGRRRVVLTREMSGRLKYRGLTISFAFGPAPEPEAAGTRPGRVPLRFRKGVLARDEWPFAVFSWAVYGAVFYLAAVLSGLPVPEAPRPEAVARRFARLIYEAPQAPSRARTELLKQRQETHEQEAEPEPEPAPEHEPTVEPAAESAAAPEPAAAPAQPRPEPAPAEPAPAGPAGPTRQQLRERVAKRGLLGILGGRGPASTARRRGSVLEGGGVAGDLDRVLENVEGLRAAPAGGGAAGGDGAGLATGVDEQARQVAAATAARIQRRASETVDAPREEERDAFDLQEAVARIHRTVGTYLGGIRYLYNRELRRNPDLEGKLTVRITISPEGAVLSCEIVASTLDAPRLEQAVLQRVRKWRFPPVSPEPLTVTYPFVFFPSM